MKKNAFTLMELILVMAIIAVLAGALIPMFTTTTAEARITAAEMDLDTIRTAAHMYRNDTGAWPTSLNDLVFGNGGDNWDGPYLSEVKNDPWDQAYLFLEVDALLRGEDGGQPAPDPNQAQLYVQSFGPNQQSNDCADESDDICMMVTPSP